MQIAFDNSYARLPDRFFAALAPTPVRSPSLIKVNEDLARDLGLDPATLTTPEGVAILAGNTVPDGAAPLAQAYAGHQFGGWVPQLGDGRAVLLGEVIDRAGIRRDIQLKGSGPTPFSRRGDGRAWLGPVLREYIVSEAMHALGIPTTRALAAVETGEEVHRERVLPGAVLTRVASSHIRVGTFQFFAARGDEEALRALTDHVIARHYPDAETPLDLLAAVVEAQARLIAKWMGVGFIHGVMNTDNMSIAGETIDYGPCAFMDAYHPDRVFSSIDRMGRYAYRKQPEIAVWNLAQFATALLPIMGMAHKEAIEVATRVIEGFADLFGAAWEAEFAAKLGLAQREEEDVALTYDLLMRMAKGKADFTRFFRGLSSDTPEDARTEFTDPTQFDAWLPRWQARTMAEGRVARMKAANPAFIPRNHRVEEAIAAAVSGDYAPFERLTTVLARPYDDQPDHAELMAAPAPEEVVQATFCGT
ncbi:protein adenylyltransferase SelO family protein [Nioella sp. MMSF_3534]|uniref:protein adenylyltransferase SelO n=1 Tax=Nioella sp. MMSF_3534 TaxID=3046720 RepID=UPI00273DFEF0|nr:YdiU family protein [Nioella sp. MMSF_3534]